MNKLTKPQQKVISYLQPPEVRTKTWFLNNGCDMRAVNACIKMGLVEVCAEGYRLCGQITVWRMTTDQPVVDGEMANGKDETEAEYEERRGKQGEPTHDKPIRTKRQKTACLCGCGEIANKLFRAGHDAKLKSQAKNGCPTGGFTNEQVAWLRDRGYVV